ncbi:SdiA-regulated domain-containing protein [Metapseudomonas otitidis]|uniref:SdiA-regulated domain-containing protein n=1 Tax=Metapseudomonas otitidis TaxID=319939 RepID=A0ABU3XR03_9GAMM|nr:SdiA-regulated domain-containing protein [Pseudomonas otitidis]MDV3440347.1 SdiA-regulated domain-containing protein [Pseudomonas otitidis]MEE1891689.1 SdiA-regulated domain-containing protein [Pseudomonas otitidis]QZX83417.1 SdiA-regulated domain-containing protein [Pseudomonas otitidis]WMR33248.1 SdiA-regulated domain-containing protein [Pseudomonas otitidis]
MKFPRTLRYSLLGAALILGGGALRYLHLDDRAQLWLSERNLSKGEQADSIWLPGYRAVLQGKPLAGLENDEASDLAYNPVTRTLFTVTGKTPMLVEISREGEVLRRIPLNGFANLEGVAVLENGNVAVTDERRRTLSIFTLDPLTRELDVHDADEFDLGFADSGNKGFEGIAWDPAQGRLLLGKEREPTAMFSLASDGSRSLAGELQPLPSYGLGMRNLSALSVDPRTGHVLALSAQSNLLLELDEAGEPVSFISLLGGFNGLESRIPRAEGVAMDEAGDIYMVSEPNLFYVFRRSAPQVTERG